MQGGGSREGGRQGRQDVRGGSRKNEREDRRVDTMSCQCVGHLFRRRLEFERLGGREKVSATLGLLRVGRVHSGEQICFAGDLRS